MNAHEEIRELLALAAADALEEGELRHVEEHLRTCAACAAEWEEWRALGRGLKRLPTPQAPATLVERTRLQMQAHLAARKERVWNPWLLGFLVLFSWSLALATWPVVRILSAGALSWLEPSFRSAWVSLAVYTAVGWLVGGVAAVVLAVRQAVARRTA